MKDHHSPAVENARIESNRVREEAQFELVREHARILMTAKPVEEGE
ncbi:MAG: hypothetical protein JRG90_07840 [Deltaproteobacteria bacterium]|nr:hypothetical protein [Deltaproteobacteria bacterium]